MKLVFASRRPQLLGVHIVGEMASELIHVGQGCLHFGGTIDYFIEAVFNYPTLAEAYKYAAYDGLGNLARQKPPKKKTSKFLPNTGCRTNLKALLQLWLEGGNAGGDRSDSVF